MTAIKLAKRLLRMLGLDSRPLPLDCILLLRLQELPNQWVEPYRRRARRQDVNIFLQIFTNSVNIRSCFSCILRGGNLVSRGGSLWNQKNWFIAAHLLHLYFACSQPSPPRKRPRPALTRSHRRQRLLVTRMLCPGPLSSTPEPSSSSPTGPTAGGSWGPCNTRPRRMHPELKLSLATLDLFPTRVRPGLCEDCANLRPPTIPNR